MKEELIFCPLGGSGEIGMNMNLFAYGKPDNQKWIIVDIGVTFADDSVPGIDLIIPDAGFIIDKKDDDFIFTHKRLVEEHQYLTDKYKKRSMAGKKGASIRHSANGKTLTPIPNPNPKPNNKYTYTDVFEKIWNNLIKKRLYFF